MLSPDRDIAKLINPLAGHLASQTKSHVTSYKRKWTKSSLIHSQGGRPLPIHAPYGSDARNNWETKPLSCLSRSHCHVWPRRERDRLRESMEVSWRAMETGHRQLRYPIVGVAFNQHQHQHQRLTSIGSWLARYGLLPAIWFACYPIDGILFLLIILSGKGLSWPLSAKYVHIYTYLFHTSFIIFT